MTSVLEEIRALRAEVAALRRDLIGGDAATAQKWFSVSPPADAGERMAATLDQWAERDDAAEARRLASMPWPQAEAELARGTGQQLPAASSVHPQAQTSPQGQSQASEPPTDESSVRHD